MEKPPVAKDINLHWSEEDVCFDCPCGEKHIMSESGEDISCVCGREYVLVHYVGITKDINNETKEMFNKRKERRLERRYLDDHLF